MRISLPIMAGLLLLMLTGMAANDARYQDVSVSDLIETPGAYAGKTVRVHGFLVLRFEGNSIWADEAAFRGEQYDQSVWGDATFISAGDRGRLTGRSAYVSGRFDPNQTGHLGLWPDALAEVSVVDADESDTGPSRA